MAPELTQELAQNVRDIALGAGEAILTTAQTPITVEKKKDQSPVTAADRAAHEYIVSRLAELTPTITIVSEEGDHILSSQDFPFWLVDPLDGTKEFIAGNGEYTVNIALIRQRQPVLGVVHSPSIQQTFFSFGPGKAFRQNGGGQPALINTRTPDPVSLMALTSRSHLEDQTKNFLKQKQVTAIRQLGSSFKFCEIAAGAADIYPRFGPTMEWDTAAGHAILVAAGGRVTTVEGNSLDYAKPGFKNPGFIAYGV